MYIVNARSLSEIKHGICKGKIAMVVFTSPYCPYCEIYFYILEEFKRNIIKKNLSKDIAIILVDVYNVPEAAEAMAVYSTPTTIVFHKCKPVESFVGLIDPEELETIIERYLKHSM